jgi:starch synthase
MPSQYEPCGLTQMRAQHYGAVPVARRVGGLTDSITDGVTGFLFDEYSPAGLEQAIGRAVASYGDRTVWRKLVRAAMARPFGWDRSAEQYLALYRRALALR